MADNIMNDNAKDNNADNNVIEFDSKVTEKDLLRFKFYHKYHTISGMAEIMLALIMIVLCVIFTYGRCVWCILSCVPIG